MSRRLNTFDDRSQDTANACDGFGALDTQQGRLPLVAMDVMARIADVTAETMVRQTFLNSFEQPLEATYIFPLPDRAAVTKFQMRVAGRVIEGDLKERGQARQEYDQAIEKGHRAAIAEEDRSGVFTLRVGNIPPHETATVELTLIAPLAVSDGEATFRFPLVVAPRYTSGIALDGTSVGMGVASDTDEVPDASRVTPPVLLPGFPNPIRLSLEVQLDSAKVGADAATWRDRIVSSLHSVVTEDGPPWTIRLQPAQRLDRDFILRFPVAAKAVVPSLRVSPETNGKAGVFALTLLPPAMGGAKPKPREVVFVLDRSGSMSGWKMVAARRALGRMIDTLLDQDRFTILAFDNVIEQPPNAVKKFVAATNRDRWKALEWLGGIDARGGTEMGAAIDEAMALFSSPTARSFWKNQSADQDAATHQRTLVIVTDGQVTGEDAILKRVGKAANGVKPRIFTVGIDKSVNAGFLRRLADRGQGNCELVESEERLDDAMNRIHRLIGSPVLTDVRLEPLNFDWVSDSRTPNLLPDLFADRPVMIYGRHLSNDSPLRMRVHGVGADGKPWSDEVTGQLDSTSMLLSMWGRAKVRDLEDEYAAGSGRNAKLLAEKIVQVSLETHVLSRFTAYVAVDQAAVIDQGNPLHAVVQPVEMPAGWAMNPPPLAVARCAAPLAQSLLGAIFGSGTRSSPQTPDIDHDDEELCMGSESVDSMLQEFTDTAISFTEAESLSDVGNLNEHSEVVVRLVQVLLNEAIQLGATEIHIEPLMKVNKQVGIYYRIHGKLVERDAAPFELFDAIVERIFKLANLDFTKREVPQQGQTVSTIGSVNYVWDVSTHVSPHGTAIVLKLNPSAIQAAPKQPTSPTGRKSFWK